jgi:pilus assembly protein CpaC
MPRNHRFFVVFLLALTAHTVSAGRAFAQRGEQDTVLVLGKGRSVLIATRTAVQRVSVGNPDVADAAVVSQREVVVNAKDLGTTTVIVWTTGAPPIFYSVEVTADVLTLERDLRDMFPRDSITVITRGKTVILSGRVRTAEAAARAVEVAAASGFAVLDNMSAPTARQVLLSVQVAEVDRSVAKQLSAQLRAMNPEEFAFNRSEKTIESISEGVLSFFLLDGIAQLDATIRFLKTRGLFKSLAEPNLLTLPGKPASFLAGGEFPYPVVRGSGESQNVTIIFKEFGVRLLFTPFITNSGVIRLKVSPEVSSLDFANGLRLGGFLVPTVLTRRADTEVELREGQFLAIAGLTSNDVRQNKSKIPILGDIPLIGSLFGSSDTRQSRTELLVIVTPRLIEPSNTPPALPTGNPNEWEWDGSLKGPALKPKPQQPLNPKK